MWVELAEQHGYECAEPATEADLERAAKELGTPLAFDLRELLLETNGLTSAEGAATVFDVDEIIARNLDMRRNERFTRNFMPFDALLIFGEEGGGDLCAFPIVDGINDDGAVFVWEHQTDSRISAMVDLEDFLAPPSDAE
jgi:hypothetical protein